MYENKSGAHGRQRIIGHLSRRWGRQVCGWGINAKNVVKSQKIIIMMASKSKNK